MLTLVSLQDMVMWMENLKFALEISRETVITKCQTTGFPYQSLLGSSLKTQVPGTLPQIYQTTLGRSPWCA